VASKTFRSAELIALEELCDAGKAIDVDMPGSQAEACLSDALVEAHVPAELVAKFSRKARTAAAAARGGPRETVRLAYAARYAERLARDVFEGDAGRAASRPPHSALVARLELLTEAPAAAKGAADTAALLKDALRAAARGVLALGARALLSAARV